MKISVLASGSKGNCTYVELGNTKILIDIGMPLNYIESKLEEINVDPKEINSILITHTHNDHICGFTKFYKKYKPNIYITSKMIKHLKKYTNEFNCCLYEEDILIDDVNIKTIKTSHDTDDSFGFIIDDKLVYITDTGYINEKYFELLENKHIYIVESNHDVEMLLEGKYPYYLKQRILSDKGHLSNKATSLYLSKLIGNNTKHIFLAHLSAENNSKEKALETLKEYIITDDKNIVVASQNERTELIEI